MLLHTCIKHRAFEITCPNVAAKEFSCGVVVIGEVAGRRTLLLRSCRTSYFDGPSAEHKLIFLSTFKHFHPSEPPESVTDSPEKAACLGR